MVLPYPIPSMYAKSTSSALASFNFPQTKSFKSQMLHVWNIYYTWMVEFYGKFVGKYTIVSWMLWDGIQAPEGHNSTYHTLKKWLDSDKMHLGQTAVYVIDSCWWDKNWYQELLHLFEHDHWKHTYSWMNPPWNRISSINFLPTKKRTNQFGDGIEVQ